MMLLIGTMLAHLGEETYTGFRQRFPLGEMSRSRFLGINLLLYGYCVLTCWLLENDRPLGRPLARLLALGMAGNGAGHLGIMVWRRRYFPGGLTALPLFLVALHLLRHD